MPCDYYLKKPTFVKINVQNVDIRHLKFILKITTEWGSKSKHYAIGKAHGFLCVAAN